MLEKMKSDYDELRKSSSWINDDQSATIKSLSSAVDNHQTAIEGTLNLE